MSDTSVPQGQKDNVLPKKTSDVSSSITVIFL